MLDPTPLRLRAAATKSAFQNETHASLCPKSAVARRTRQVISRIWTTSPTKRPAQGGAGSKCAALGCDPGAGHRRAITRGPFACLRGRIPASGAPAPRSGTPPILGTTRRAGASFAPGLCRTACEYSRYSLRRASRPEAKSCQRRRGFIMLGTLSICY